MMPDLKGLFAAAFADEEYQHFEGRAGKTMTYVEDETVMDRLDAVLGVGKWQIQTDPVPVYDGVVKVRLGVFIDGDWRWYEDYGYPNRQGGEALKEAVSDGIRRCGRYLGIARDLYRRDSTPQTNGNGHAATQRPPAPPQAHAAADDPYGASLAGGAVAVAPARSEGTMWSKELFERAETAGIDKRQISDTAKKMYGKDKWKVTDLTDGERFALAVELELA